MKSVFVTSLYFYVHGFLSFFPSTNLIDQLLKKRLIRKKRTSENWTSSRLLVIIIIIIIDIINIIILIWSITEFWFFCLSWRRFFFLLSTFTFYWKTHTQYTVVRIWQMFHLLDLKDFLSFFWKIEILNCRPPSSERYELLWAKLFFSNEEKKIQNLLFKRVTKVTFDQ